MIIQATLDISKLWGLFFTSSNYPKCILVMVGESNQNALLIQIDASSFAEFEISEFEIARVDCTVTFDSLSDKINMRSHSS